MRIMSTVPELRLASRDINAETPTSAAAETPNPSAIPAGSPFQEMLRTLVNEITKSRKPTLIRLAAKFSVWNVDKTLDRFTWGNKAETTDAINTSMAVVHRTKGRTPSQYHADYFQRARGGIGRLCAIPRGFFQGFRPSAEYFRSTLFNSSMCCSSCSIGTSSWLTGRDLFNRSK